MDTKAPGAPLRRIGPRQIIGLLVAVVGIAALALVLAPRQSETEQLSALPEASLIYPASTLLRHGSHRALAQNPAAIWFEYSSEASVEDILAFYTDELATRGFEWGAGSSTTRAVEESRACGWQRDRDDLLVRVSFWRPESYTRKFPEDPAYSTVYDVRVMVDEIPAMSILCTHDGARPVPLASATTH